MGLSDNKAVPSAQPNKPAPALKIINGVIERITFQNSETGYTIAKLSASSADGDQPPGNVVVVTMGGPAGVAPGAASGVVEVVVG